MAVSGIGIIVLGVIGFAVLTAVVVIATRR